jgi:epoxide hydrolase-like predicted phosphatase
MIKAIIFDVGGVILNVDGLLTQAVNVFHPSDKNKFWELLNIELVPLSKGKGTLLQTWQKVAKKMKTKVSNDILKSLWIKGYRESIFVDKNIAKILCQLKKKYKLAVISHTIKEHIKISGKFEIFKIFEVSILSHKAHLTKDKKDIFLVATKKLKVKPEECIFIDDIKFFLKAPKALGMKTIYFKNPQQLKKDLKSLGLPL